MAYGTIKVDTITFTDAGVDKSVTISGLVQNPTFSGNITVTGTISGNTIQGQTVSGVTVTGTTAAFTSGTFTTITGGTATITSGVFASGTAAAPSVSVGTTDNGIYSPGADQVAVATNGTGRLFVDASGNVQIGSSFAGFGNGSGVEIERSTTSTLRLTGNSGVGCEFFNTGSLASIQTRSAIPFTIQTNELERLRITSAGLVGIGTSSPAGKTEIVSSGSESTLILRNSSSALSTYSELKFAPFTGTTAASAAIRADYYQDNNSTLAFRTTTINAEPTTKLFITSGGNVGIGTTIPSNQLTVGANATSTITLDWTGDNLPKATFSANHSTGEVRIGATNNSGTYFTTLYSNNSEAVRIDSSRRLLVGTSSARGNFFNTSYTPQLQLEGVGQQQSMLSVVNSVGADGGSVLALGKQRSGSIGGNTILQSGDQIGELTYQGSDGTELVAAASITAYVDGTPGANDMPGRLVFSTTADGASSATERLRITSAGLVGVGTSAPVSTLDAAGDISITGNENYLYLYSTALVGSNARARIRAVGSGGGSGYGGDFRVSTRKQDNNWNTDAFVVDSSGNVGIGTTSPSALLHVVGIGGAIRMQDTTATSKYIQMRSDLTNSHLEHIGGPGDALRINNQAAGTIEFFTSGIEKARIDSSGRLLVGTSSAQGSSTVTIEQTAANSAPLALRYTNTNDNQIGIDFYRSRSSSAKVESTDPLMRLDAYGYDGSAYRKGASIEAIVDAATSAGDMPCRLVFSTTADGASSPTERLRITSAGLVGIGTSTPGANLEVFGDTADVVLTSVTNNNATGANKSLNCGVGGATAFSVPPWPNSGFIDSATTNGLALGSSSSTGSVRLYTGTSREERLRITSAGNVGIGSTVPNEKLTVADSGSANVYIALQNSTTGTTSADGWYLGAAGTEFQIYGKENGPITFSPNSTERARIDSSGRLLVGTSTSLGDGAQVQSVSAIAQVFDGYNFREDNVGSELRLGKARGGSSSSPTILSSGDSIGRVIFRGHAGATSGFLQAAYIDATVDGTPGTNDMPGRIVLATTADGASSPTERMRIDSSGRLLVGTSSASGANLLQVNSDALVNGLTVGRGASNDSNTAVLGNGALAAETGGTGNVAIGRQAVNSLTTGSYNIGVGYLALSDIVSNSGSIMIGGVTSAGSYSPASNITASDRISIGSTSVTDAFIQVAWTVVSDARDKTNFSPVPHGLDFVTALKPTAFQFKLDRESSQPNGRVRYGFKAQDILELEGENGIIINSENPEKLYYNGESLIPVLVNAIKELSAKNTALEARLTAAGID
jgi:hypothetical protein